jgi:hypothetical protein
MGLFRRKRSQQGCKSAASDATDADTKDGNSTNPSDASSAKETEQSINTSKTMKEDAQELIADNNLDVMREIVMRIREDPEFASSIYDECPRLQYKLDQRPDLRPIFEDPHLVRINFEHVYRQAGGKLPEDEIQDNGAASCMKQALIKFVNSPLFKCLRLLLLFKKIYHFVTGGGLAMLGNCCQHLFAMLCNCFHSVFAMVSNCFSRIVCGPGLFQATAQPTATNTNASQSAAAANTSNGAQPAATANNSTGAQPTAAASAAQHAVNGSAAVAQPDLYAGTGVVPDSNAQLAQSLNAAADHMQDPEVAEQMNELLANDPEGLQDAINNDPSLSALRDSNPLCAELMSDPNTMRIMVDPDNLRALGECPSLIQADFADPSWTPPDIETGATNGMPYADVATGPAVSSLPIDANVPTGASVTAMSYADVPTTGASVTSLPAGANVPTTTTGGFMATVTQPAVTTLPDTGVPMTGAPVTAIHGANVPPTTGGFMSSIDTSQIGTSQDVTGTGAASAVDVQMGADGQPDTSGAVQAESAQQTAAAAPPAAAAAPPAAAAAPPAAAPPTPAAAPPAAAAPPQFALGNAPAAKAPAAKSGNNNNQGGGIVSQVAAGVATMVTAQLASMVMGDTGLIDQAANQADQATTSAQNTAQTASALSMATDVMDNETLNSNLDKLEQGMDQAEAHADVGAGAVARHAAMSTTEDVIIAGPCLLGPDGKKIPDEGGVAVAAGDADTQDATQPPGRFAFVGNFFSSVSTAAKEGVLGTVLGDDLAQWAVEKEEEIAQKDGGDVEAQKDVTNDEPLATKK